MENFTPTRVAADKYERLLKVSNELARMNAELVQMVERQGLELTALIERNDEVLSQCFEFLAGSRANGNGSLQGKSVRQLNPVSQG